MANYFEALYLPPLNNKLNYISTQNYVHQPVMLLNDLGDVTLYLTKI